MEPRVLGPRDYAVTLAHFMQWDTEQAYEMAYALLEEVNAHDLSAALKDAYEESDGEAMANPTTTLRLSPHVLDCLDKVARDRFGPDAQHKRSLTITQLLLEECKRIGVREDESQERRERAR